MALDEINSEEIKTNLRKKNVSMPHLKRNASAVLLIVITYFAQDYIRYRERLAAAATASEAAKPPAPTNVQQSESTAAGSEKNKPDAEMRSTDKPSRQPERPRIEKSSVPIPEGWIRFEAKGIDVTAVYEDFRRKVKSYKSQETRYALSTINPYFSDGMYRFVCTFHPSGDAFNSFALLFNPQNGPAESTQNALLKNTGSEELAHGTVRGYDYHLIGLKD